MQVELSCFSPRCWSKWCGYSLVLLRNGAHIELCYECKSLIFFFRCISQSPSCNHLSLWVISHPHVIVLPLGDIVYLFCFYIWFPPPVLVCTWFRGKYSKYKPLDSHFYSSCISVCGVSVGLPCRLSSVSNADYRLPGYPGIGRFLKYSNTRVIGSSTRVVTLIPWMGPGY